MSALPQPRLSQETEGPYLEFEAAWDELAVAVRRARVRLSGQLSGLTIAQYQLIEPLEGGTSMSVGRLADAAGVAGPTATRMLDGLERARIVVRHHSSEDRRMVNVALTEEGERLAAEKRRAVDGVRRTAFARLTPDEQMVAPALMQKIADAMGQL